MEESFLEFFGRGRAWSAAPEAHAGGVGRRPGPEGRAERRAELEEKIGGDFK